MNAQQLSLTHYLCPYKLRNTKYFLVRSYLYRSNEWLLGRRLMDSSDLSGWSRWCRQWFKTTKPSTFNRGSRGHNRECDIGLKNIKDESKTIRYGRYSCKKLGFKTEYSMKEYQFESGDYFTYRDWTIPACVKTSADRRPVASEHQSVAMHLAIDQFTLNVT